MTRHVSPIHTRRHVYGSGRVEWDASCTLGRGEVMRAYAPTKEEAVAALRAKVLGWTATVRAHIRTARVIGAD